MQETYNADGSRETKDLTGVGETYSTTDKGYRTTGSIVNGVSSKKFEGVNGASARVTDGKVNGVKTDSGVDGKIQKAITEASEKNVVDAKAKETAKATKLSEAQSQLQTAIKAELTKAGFDTDKSREEAYQEAVKKALTNTLVEKYNWTEEDARKIAGGVKGSLTATAGINQGLLGEIVGVEASLKASAEAHAGIDWSTVEKDSRGFDKAFQEQLNKEIGKTVSEKSGEKASFGEATTATLQKASNVVNMRADEYSEAVKETQQAMESKKHAETNGLNMVNDVATHFLQDAYNKGGEHGLQNALNKISTYDGMLDVLSDYSKRKELYENADLFNKTNIEDSTNYKKLTDVSVDINATNARNVADVNKKAEKYENQIKHTITDKNRKDLDEIGQGLITPETINFKLEQDRIDNVMKMLNIPKGDWEMERKRWEISLGAFSGSQIKKAF